MINLQVMTDSAMLILFQSTVVMHMPPLRHHSKLFQQMMYHQTICTLSLQNDHDMTTILLKCIVQGIRIWVKIGSLICAGKLEDRPFFSLNFKGIPSQESFFLFFYFFLFFIFFIIYSRKVQIYIADTRFQERNQEKHMVIWL